MALLRTLACVGEEVPYHYVMGVTGVAFRFTFGPEHWNPGFYGFGGVGPDVSGCLPYTNHTIRSKSSVGLKTRIGALSGACCTISPALVNIT